MIFAGIAFALPVPKATDLLSKGDEAAAGVQHVFWSGGRLAEDAARTSANANHGVILADTAAGRALAQITRERPWSEVRDDWVTLSEQFARSASSQVTVFQNARGLSVDSIWRLEYKIPQNNEDVTGITFRVVNPDGSITHLP